MRDVAYVHEGSPPQTNLVRVNGSRAVLMTILKAGSASTLERHRRHQVAAAPGRGKPAAEPQPARRRRSVDLRQSRRLRRDPRSRARGGAGRPDDPAVPRQLALDHHHPHRDPALDPVLADRAVVARRDDQRHDARRARARRRHPGRRRHRHDREHQLPSGTGQADRAGDHGRRAADRHARLRDAARASASCSCRCSSLAASPAICSGRWRKPSCSR